MIVLVGSEKGGTGKTTIATNLAAMRALDGFNVMLLDTDLQGSATHWSRTRGDAKIVPAVFCDRKFGRIDEEITELTRKFDDIIIDSGGRDSEELRSSMLVADRVYIPISPSQFDLWSLTPMAAMAEKAAGLNRKMKTRILLNRASTNPSVTEAEEAREIIHALDGLEMSAALLRDRIAFRRAVRDGLAVVEMKPRDGKAVDEIQTLYQEIYHG